jgi:hypothetical protein
MGDIGDIWRERDAHRRKVKAGSQQPDKREKPHACDKCKRRFAQPEQLSQHRKDAHGIKPPKKQRTEEESETVGDFWRAVKCDIQADQLRRANNRAEGAQVLAEQDIQFTSKNDGAHLVVRAGQKQLVDFWPGTGLWIVRGTTQRCRGVRALIDFCKGA